MKLAGVRQRVRGSLEKTVERATKRAVTQVLNKRLRAETDRQVKRTWNDVWVRNSDGSLLSVHKAFSDIYLRQQRIEAKLDRILGAENAPRPGNRSAKRRYRIPLAVSPAGAVPVNRADLDLVVDYAMFVPRVLAERGLGGYEPGCFAHFLTILERAPEGAVLDVGANIGPYGLLARAYSNRTVVGFEPDAALQQVAVDCGRRNGLDYEVEAIALGASEGEATLYLSDSTDSSNSLNPNFRANSFVLRVPLETLDHYVERTGLRPMVIKIDTETTEPDVVRGALRTIGELRPWLMCEVLDVECGQQLMELLKPFDYAWYHITGPGQLEPKDKIVGDPSGNFMWIFAPEPISDEQFSRSLEWNQALVAAGPGQELDIAR